MVTKNDYELINQLAQFEKLNPQDCLQRAVLGVPALLDERTAYTKLSPSARVKAKKAGVYLRASHYKLGLVSFKHLETNRTIALDALIVEVQSNLLVVVSDPLNQMSIRFNELHEEYLHCKQLIHQSVHATKNTVHLVKVLDDIRKILAEIAVLLSPPEILQTIKPHHKFNVVMSHLGLYIVSLAESKV